MQDRNDELNDIRRSRGRAVDEQLEAMQRSLDALKKTFSESGDLVTLTEPPIPDMLAWQAEIDRHRIGMNLRGSDRFWNTIQYHTGVPFHPNGAPPPFDELLIVLTEDVGLKITAEGEDHGGDIGIATWMDVRFVPVINGEHGWTESETRDASV